MSEPYRNGIMYIKMGKIMKYLVCFLNDGKTYSKNVYAKNDAEAIQKAKQINDIQSVVNLDENKTVYNRFHKNTVK